ncbi:MAG TPA: ABC transporter permease [Phototrophicaceae bacterium]|nr:ABC transporter permease [Phototrophicaceae bacterium]
MQTTATLKRSNLISEDSVLRRLLRNRSGAVGFVIIVIFVILGILGALHATPYPPAANHPKDRMKPPSAQYLLGTDQLGRDEASRLMEGAANSLRVAVFSVALAGVIGTALGAISGYAGGWVDTVIMRIMDVFFALPAILMALVIVSVLGAGINTTILAIAIVYTPIFARVARGPVLSLKSMEFVLAARSIGVRGGGMLWRHILPNTLAPLIVQVSLALSWSILTEAGLSFLGLGVQPPASSWGVMLSDSRALAINAPWLMLFPGAAIVLGVLGFNLLGDGLRDVLDPRLRGLS